MAHEHFVADPRELFFYAIHELHHVGFMNHRPIADLSCMADPDCLRDAVRYFTQLEGMAVHSAYAPRKKGEQLEGDDDYLVYTDKDEAKRVIERYNEVLALCDEGEPGAVLEPMSSGERLWYRYGALMAWRLEQQEGIETLVGSIVEPRMFYL